MSATAICPVLEGIAEQLLRIGLQSRLKQGPSPLEDVECTC